MIASECHEWVKESRNPRHRPTLSDFRDASKRLNGVALRTPLLPLRRYKEADTGIFLKPEMLQPIGSYKIRGVYNWAAQLTPEERSRGISTLSAGNMAQAVGYVANIFNVPARVAIVDTAPKYKIEATKKYGAEVDLIPGDALRDYLEHPPHDYLIISPFGEYGLMDGHGTIGLEIVEDVPEVDTIFVPVGSGFLASGISLAAKALNPGVKVIGVNAENCPHYYNFLHGGGSKVFYYKPTLADGIAGKYYVPDELYELVRESLDEVVVVSEDEIAGAVRFLALENKLVAEGAGAICLAAALAMPKEERGKSVCVLSGGSIDAEKLAHIIDTRTIKG